VSMADLFTDGYRRMMANMLTMDEQIKAVRVVADKKGVPLKDGDGFPAYPIAWTRCAVVSPKTAPRPIHHRRGALAAANSGK
ncbi:MAG: hypothetical protein MUF54_24845, partial [Polyangiaceae bacterium]|nr:hypothetical protein [Polyangiaceae bacterium]